MKKLRLIAGTSFATAMVLGAPVRAQNAADGPDAQQADSAGSDTLTEVIVTGTRQTGISAADSASPIQLVGVAALQRVGQPNLLDALAQSLPSFNAQHFGGDTAALTLQAALRGLNPNQTLVLVNGKRLHGSANLQVDAGSPYQGAAAADLSFIPVGGIDHVEVLTDGAAAQYGSDAIAGVVNIILKKSATAGQLSTTVGQYYAGDGKTAAGALNKGMPLGDKGFLNVTLEAKWHDFSRRGGCDQRFSAPDCTFLNAGPAPIDNTNIPLTPRYPYMNNIIGDPQYDLYNAMYNLEYDLTDHLHAYSFGGYGRRLASTYQNYRSPSKLSGVTSVGETVYPLPYGFSPREKFSEDSYSFTVGLKGDVAGWNWDLSSVYGQDAEDVYTVDSANVELFQALQALQAAPITDPQRNFYDGRFVASEWTSNLDINRNFDIGVLATPVSVAFGGEFRRNTYSIGVGEPSSYFGGIGGQSFSGYSPLNAGSHARHNSAAYIDLAADVIPNLHVDLAARHENYSDFGSTTVEKGTVRYDFNSVIAIRGTASTGFRAPTPQEEFYEGINVNPAFIAGQLPPNSAAAVTAGFGPLHPETSHNYSVGFVLHPLDRMQLSADFYQININDRIVGSGFLLGKSGATVYSQPIMQALQQLGTDPYGAFFTGVQLFTNGADTRTRGAEVTLSYPTDFGPYGRVNWTAGFNYNKTDLISQRPLPAGDYAPEIGQTALLSPYAVSSLTDATPSHKSVLAGYWTLGEWSVNLREEIYGAVSQWLSPDVTGTGPNAVHLTQSMKGVTDLEVGYELMSRMKISVGANNLFNVKPVIVPLYNSGGHLAPVDGGNIMNEPFYFAPFGMNGGYYYARLTIDF